MAISGMQMMLKSLGIDPAAIQKQIEAQLSAIEKTARSIDERLRDIQSRVAAIETRMGEQNGNVTSNPHRGSSRELSDSNS